MVSCSFHGMVQADLWFPGWEEQEEECSRLELIIAKWISWKQLGASQAPRSANVARAYQHAGSNVAQETRV